MADSLKHNPPEVKLIYHPNGEIAEVNISLPIPRAVHNPPLKRKRSRLDSGFDDDPAMVASHSDQTNHVNKVLEEEEGDEGEEGGGDEDLVFLRAAVQNVSPSRELRIDMPRLDSKECDTDDDVTISSAQPMIKSSDKKFEFIKVSSVRRMLGNKQPCNSVLIVLVLLLLVGIVALLIFHFSETKIEVSQNASNSTATLTSHRLRTPAAAPSFFRCHLDCFEKSKQLLSIKDGRASCSNNTVHLECKPGFEAEAELSITCQDLDQKRKAIQCLPSSRCNDKNQSSCGADVLLLVGGELNGKLLDSMETFPVSAYSGCLPRLPQPVKWGSLAFLENSLFFCGGENSAEQPSKTCWTLETGRQWRWFGDLAR